MNGYRIQIIKAKLDSYWYAGATGNTYWAVKHNKDDTHQDFRIVEEGTILAENIGAKYVDIDDCLILKETLIRIDTLVTVKVVEMID